MSIDYTKYPYSKWYKCSHTCEHPNPHASRTRNAMATYKVENETIVVGSIKVFHCNSRMLRSHVISSTSHPNCANSQCPMKKWLNNENSSNHDFQTPLTAEDWRRWGLGIALRNGTLKTSAKDVPQEYIDRFLAEFPERREQVLEALGEQATRTAPATAVQARSEVVQESPSAQSPSITQECPPSAGPSTNLIPVNADQRN